MKKYLHVLFVLLCFSILAGCNLPSAKSIQVDYKNAEEFEAALNSGVDGVGKIVTFTVTDFKPDSAFGFNLMTGEHLNFCSVSHPKTEIGEDVTVRVTGIQSFLGSYIITYEKLK